MDKPYSPREIEPKWQRKWEEAGVFRVDLEKAKDPFYLLVMFPYPSGAQLHVGHWFQYSLPDSYGRFLKMRGREVFHPMGFDAFGLPAENYAIKTGVPPAVSTAQNVEKMIDQYRKMGVMYPWEYLLNTSEPQYYRWTQWLFLQMYGAGLAYKKLGNVNWCPKDQTVLANEQVLDGACERCGTQVVQKALSQWYWRITAYAEQLLNDMDGLDWPERTRLMQKNWIGKSEGAEVVFEVCPGFVGRQGMDIAWTGLTEAGMRTVHLIFSPQHRNRLFEELSEATELLRILKSVAEGHGIALHEIAVMPEHVHLLVSFDAKRHLEKDIVKKLKGSSAREFLRRRRTPGFVPSGQHLGGTQRLVNQHLGSLVSPRINSGANQTGMANHNQTDLAAADAAENLGPWDDIVSPRINSGANQTGMANHNQTDLAAADAAENLGPWDDIEHLWGEKKHFKEIENDAQFQATLNYIRSNPKEAGLDPAGRTLSELPETVTVFTTRPDTLFGATYLVLAPEHPLVDAITTPDRADAVNAYKAETKKKTELMRQESREKTGEFTGAYAINPANGEQIPVWIADYVLMNYGTGAIMAVPAHDERDFDFSIKYNIERRCVIDPDLSSTDATFDVIYRGGGSIAFDVNETGSSVIPKAAELKAAIVDARLGWKGEGTLINSDFLNGLDVSAAKQAMTDWLEQEGKGRKVVNYRLRDWLVSRQRYWGAPIPIVYDPDGNPHPVPEEHLPWLLPTDVEFLPTGESPLRQSREFLERTERIFGTGWTPEYDTMDTFVCSSFYYLRFLMSGQGSVVSGQNHEEKKLTTHHSPLTTSPGDQFVNLELEKKFLPVDLYIGGPEHATMHLIYARFVMKALRDLGHVTHAEPFQRLVHQGLITNQGAKMSKSKGNVVSPDDYVARYGSDVFRMFLMFMGPFTDGGDWSDTGIRGIDRFTQRAWKLLTEKVMDDEEAPQVRQALHAAIKRVTESIDRLQFNTAVSALMEFLNAAEAHGSVSRETAQIFVRMLTPLAPHLAEELWERLGEPASAEATASKKEFAIQQPWPAYDPALLVADTLTIAVQVNGRLRGSVEVSAQAGKEEILAAAKAEPNVQKHLQGAAIKKEIYVPGKLVNVVL